METVNVILGVDISKLTLDICCAERELHLKIDNDTMGFSVFKKWCKTNEIDLKETLIVMEYTGGYEYRFIQFCEVISVAYCRISWLDINILRLRQLRSFRKRLVRENAGFTATIKERKHIYEVDKKDTVIRIATQKIKANGHYIRQIEGEIAALIKASTALLQNYRILTNIKGIGQINAWMTLAYTENFTSFTDARKYAVYVGVVPFDNSSGMSLKGKNPQVRYIAHKDLKPELNQAAKSAIAHDPKLRNYAERKLKNKHYK